jgi:hypothetical protein
MSSPSFRCAACGGTDLAGPHPYTTFEDFIAIPGAREGFFSSTLNAQAARARICRDCGHVMYFVDEQTLDVIRKGRR